MSQFQQDVATIIERFKIGPAQCRADGLVYPWELAFVLGFFALLLLAGFYELLSQGFSSLLAAI